MTNRTDTTDKQRPARAWTRLLLSSLFLLASTFGLRGQITVLGRTAYDTVTPAFFTQNNNAAIFAAGLGGILTNGQLGQVNMQGPLWLTNNVNFGLDTFGLLFVQGSWVREKNNGILDVLGDAGINLNPGGGNLALESGQYQGNAAGLTNALPSIISTNGSQAGWLLGNLGNGNAGWLNTITATFSNAWFTGYSAYTNMANLNGVQFHIGNNSGALAIRGSGINTNTLAVESGVGSQWIQSWSVITASATNVVGAMDTNGSLTLSGAITCTGTNIYIGGAGGGTIVMADIGAVANGTNALAWNPAGLIISNLFVIQGASSGLQINETSLTNTGNFGVGGDILAAKGLGSMATNRYNLGLTTYNTGTLGTTNISLAYEVFDVTASSATIVQFDGLGNAWATNTTLTGTLPLLLQGGGYWTNSGTVTLNGEHAF